MRLFLAVALVALVAGCDSAPSDPPVKTPAFVGSWSRDAAFADTYLTVSQAQSVP